MEEAIVSSLEIAFTSAGTRTVTVIQVMVPLMALERVQMLEGAQTQVAPMLVFGMVGADMVVSAVGKRPHRSQSNKRETKHTSKSKSRHRAVRKSSGLNRRWRFLTVLPCPTTTLMRGRRTVLRECQRWRRTRCTAT